MMLTRSISFWAILYAILLNHIPSAVLPASGFQEIASTWKEPDNHTSQIITWPKDLSRDVIPVPVHSHNDYWRTVPLFDALAAGCTGVEADIWLRDGDILVGHDESSLTLNRTLRSLYLNPLQQILQQQNKRTLPNDSPRGVFESSPNTTLVLLIDIKSDAFAIWPTLLSQLQPLRNQSWVTFYDGVRLVRGPITIVGTGNTPFSLILNTTDSIPAIDNGTQHRTIFFDAPLSDMSSPLYNYTNSFYASIALSKAIGRTPAGTLSKNQESIVASQVAIAKSKGLRARYWDSPTWPIKSRDRVWTRLAELGVGMLNADDILAATRGNWEWCSILGVKLC